MNVKVNSVEQDNIKYLLAWLQNSLECDVAPR